MKKSNFLNYSVFYHPATLTCQFLALCWLSQSKHGLIGCHVESQELFSRQPHMYSVCICFISVCLLNVCQEFPLMPASKPTFFSPLVNYLKCTCTSTGARCSVCNHWTKIFPTEELGQLGWVLWNSVLWQHCKTGRSIHERGIGWCRVKSGSGCLHWVCTLVLLSFSCSNKCRKIS